MIPTGPVWIRLDRRGIQPEQARSVWSRPPRRRAPGYGTGGRRLERVRRVLLQNPVTNVGDGNRPASVLIVVDPCQATVLQHSGHDYIDAQRVGCSRVSTRFLPSQIRASARCGGSPAICARKSWSPSSSRNSESLSSTVAPPLWQLWMPTGWQPLATAPLQLVVLALGHSVRSFLLVERVWSGPYWLDATADLSSGDAT
jgi:hypothetical protein